jgi:hypothetical protein
MQAAAIRAFRTALSSKMVTRYRCLGCAVLLLARVSPAQAADQDQGISPVALMLVAVLGAACGVVLLSLACSLLWKWYKGWRDAPIVKVDKVMESLYKEKLGLIPFGDIEFDDADLFHLFYNDDIQTTPRSIENNEKKR